MKMNPRLRDWGLKIKLKNSLKDIYLKIKDKRLKYLFKKFD